MTDENLRLLVIVGSSFGIFLILRILVFPALKRIAKKTNTIIDDLFLEKKFLNRLSFVAVFTFLNGIVFTEFSIDLMNSEVGQRIISSFLAIFLGLTLNELLSILNNASSKYDALKDRPIKGYIQIVKIILNAFIFIIVFAILSGQSVTYYISGLGALTAVLLLVFQDTILSFVASVQIGQNNIINNGDWIEVPEYGADGDVIDIALHTVKVQNWDKTITSIPTSKIISTSVKNWRGMSEFGGRRIMRSITVDISSIKFLSIQDIENLKKIPPIKSYLDEKIKEVEMFNNDSSNDTSQIEQRNLTNIGTFRAYVENYLRQNESLDTQNMTFLVRQLAPTNQGVSIQIYTFTKTTDWVEYEKIQSDIFDHLLAVLHKFDLRAYQDGIVEAAAMKNLHFNEGLKD
ncbi:MAG: mechanosensitive ion channel family protein [Candidatus Actinomarina sp.]|jgi:miniconductance mechanosensitive channel|uniref:Small-conductance mechanosensitive channel n=1 Tax=Candidatus Actinomarina minuta TaxID=1389454 RepID=S5DQZ9_9ACTN|nr:small-conductance mechanosensitive channel [Candidatus Actinomarina minuta]AGQ19218.1 small-conductance mechanosensitive channel [Candidatus Actinomarina minuta]AGQ19310.1 small-conductance mechanosensitive channel [Candidatus Actinomarina minuta]|tara:strand:+ start:3373 stop:4581 length:1209 start_codon:yes stop_codon:yes gene_type:complete